MSEIHTGGVDPKEYALKLILSGQTTRFPLREDVNNVQFGPMQELVISQPRLPLLQRPIGLRDGTKIDSVTPAAFTYGMDSDLNMVLFKPDMTVIQIPVNDVTALKSIRSGIKHYLFFSVIDKNMEMHTVSLQVGSDAIQYLPTDDGGADFHLVANEAYIDKRHSDKEICVPFSQIFRLYYFRNSIRPLLRLPSQNRGKNNNELLKALSHQMQGVS